MKAIIKTGNIVGVENTNMPTITRDDDVLIRIALAGLCRTDIYVAQGRIPSKSSLILGHEFSGIVEKTGEKTNGFKQDDRVAVMPLFPAMAHQLSTGLPCYANATMMGIDHDGAFCEYTVVPASAVYKLPETVSLMQGAYLEPVAASMAVLNTSIKPEQKGLVFGENRISRTIERILIAKGFKDITVCESDEDLPENHFDFIIETLATTETMSKIVASVKAGGCIILKSRQHTPVGFNINKLVMKCIRIESVSYGDFQAGIDMIASGMLMVDDLFGDVFKLEQFENVFAQSQHSESKKLFFSTRERDVWDC